MAIRNFFKVVFKNIIRIWDPDFRKLTPKEVRQIIKAEQSGFVSNEEIDWSKIGL